MARYRRIIADQYVDMARPPYERRCCHSPTGDRQKVAVVPGTALVAGPDLLPGQQRYVPAGAGPMEFRTPTFAVAGVNPTGAIFIADINTLAGGDMYQAWGFDSIEAIMFDGRALNVAVPTGVSIFKGANLTTNAQGWFVPAGPSDRAIMIADETFNNNTGVYQHVRAIPT